MNIRSTIAAKKIGGEWHGALVVNNMFQRAMIESSLNTLMDKGLSSLLPNDAPEGAVVTLDLNVVPSVSGDTEDDSGLATPD